MRMHKLHQRYQLQATWTAPNRRRLYATFNLQHSTRILEVGSGTGVITRELSSSGSAHVYGVDIDRHAAAYAFTYDPDSNYGIADGHRLPFKESVFDVALCHYFLLWVANPNRILDEMIRVTRPGGMLAAIAEPDYGGRIDHPSTLVALGTLQARALESHGADPRMGRKLRALFSQAGLQSVFAGVLAGEWRSSPDEEAFDSEWEMLREDLGSELSEQEHKDFRRLDHEATEQGERILYVPTFYAVGIVANDKKTSNA